MQLLNKRMAAPKVDENDKNGPETWYKVVVKTGTEEVHESSSRSEDELSMSQGMFLPMSALDPMSLIISQKRASRKRFDHKYLIERL